MVRCGRTAAPGILLSASPELLAAVLAVMTLEPGDLLLTGTPEGIGPLYPGDRVAVEIEGVGVLENVVVPGDSSPEGPGAAEQG